MNNGLHAIPVKTPVPATPVEDGTSLLRTLAVLRRRGWILVAVVAASLAAALVASRSRPPHYRAEATVEVGPDNPLAPADAPPARDRGEADAGALA